MSGLFISYRRDDCRGWAGRLADTLQANLDENLIFLDIESIPPGDDFVDAIENAVGSCNVMLALIGPHWLNAPDKQGKRRLDDPNDFVRLEIATAIAQKKKIIPVLFAGATMPDAAELPTELSPLARRQALELSDTRWQYDSEQLMNAIQTILGKPRKSTVATPATDKPDISVAENLQVSRNAEVGNIIGANGAAPPSGQSLNVAKNAKIRGKTGDIIGIHFNPEPKP